VQLLQGLRPEHSITEKNMLIKKKIALMIILPIVALVILGTITMRGQHSINAMLQELNRNVVPSLKATALIQQEVTVMHAVVYRHVLSEDEKDMDKQADRIKSFKGKVDGLLDTYEKELVSNEADRAAIKGVRTGFDAYNQFAEQVVTASRSGDKVSAKALMSKEATAKRKGLTDALEAVRILPRKSPRKAKVNSPRPYASASALPSS
jgi:methyl-accepting chemotaxis protein